MYALRDRRVVNGFVGAQGEDFVREFVDSLLPTEEEDAIGELIAAGDEASLRSALEIEPGNSDAITALAELLIGDGRGEEALGPAGAHPGDADDAPPRGARPHRRRRARRRRRRAAARQPARPGEGR